MIFKTKKERSFSMIDNKVINDNRLSFKARGVLIYLLSKPENWITRKGDLIRKSDKDGDTAIRSALKELRDVGYAELVKGGYVGDDGKMMVGTFYNIYEKPII